MLSPVLMNAYGSEQARVPGAGRWESLDDIDKAIEHLFKTAYRAKRKPC